MRTFLGLIFLFYPSLFSLFRQNVCLNGNLNAQVAINNSGLSANSSSMLDVDVDDKGVLIPRISLNSATDNTTVPSPEISLLVYNTDTSGTSPNIIFPGFYQWNGSKWISLSKQPGTPGIYAFADFYALMPPDNPATVAPGAAVVFPNLGPSSGSEISAFSTSQFRLSEIGTYMVNWQVSVTEAGQLGLELNGTLLPATVIGRSTGTSQIVGNRLITTSIVNSLLRVINPAGNPVALTITPIAGGASAVSASIVIMRIL